MKAIKLIILSTLILLGTLVNGNAQPKKAPQKAKEPSPIGFGINLGNVSFYNHSFQFGLSPNVAYRVGESLALGFMLKANYYYQKFPEFQVKFSAFDFGPTVFARYKPLWSWDAATPFLRGLFLQAEYERGFLTRYLVYRDNQGFTVPVIIDGKLQRDKFQEDFAYIGIGASNGYPFSTFVSIHYNLLDNFESARDPFEYRIGFTYNY
ncbi:MAG: hypothetical protein IPP15_17905 [Saprospiraceae bacterium]|uniref:Outer membrane protein beta-barrel domain-containing protein n=1 Tax=Candidatus Opimibacter skivensis TaxID=2982028 RepID=A0A9D7SXW7_9BACT|nr:hypothetical protein [Candidatus Opimibacter skivensis]